MLRVDLILIPVLIMAFFTLQMDRGNISNVLTSTTLEDLNINTNDINAGAQLLLVGIVILELPSNILMQRVSLAWRLDTDPPTLAKLGPFPVTFSCPAH